MSEGVQSCPLRKQKIFMSSSMPKSCRWACSFDLLRSCLGGRSMHSWLMAAPVEVHLCAVITRKSTADPASFTNFPSHTSSLFWMLPTQHTTTGLGGHHNKTTKPSKLCAYALLWIVELKPLAKQAKRWKRISFLGCNSILCMLVLVFQSLFYNIMFQEKIRVTDWL